MSAVVGHLQHLLAIHEHNQVAVFSKALSQQIPRSRAAHAFQLFQDICVRYEIVRLCAIWDAPDDRAESIPTVIACINDRSVRKALVRETYEQSSQPAARLGPPPKNAEEAALLDEAYDALWKSVAHRRGCQAARGLSKAIRNSRAVLDSQQLRSARNFRHKHLAHSLLHTREELAAPVLPVSFNELFGLLETTVQIADALYLYVNGTSFAWEDARAIDRRNAQALWGNCTFELRQ